MQEDSFFEAFQAMSVSDDSAQSALSKLVDAYGLDMKALMEEAKKAEGMDKQAKARYIAELKNSLPPDQKARLDNAVSMLKTFLIAKNLGGAQH